MVKAVHWIWVVTSLWLTGYAHALAWDEITPFEVTASTPIIAAPSNSVSAQGVVTANAIHADYALWQGTQSRRDDVTAVFFQL